MKTHILSRRYAPESVCKLNVQTLFGERDQELTSVPIKEFRLLLKGTPEKCCSRCVAIIRKPKKKKPKNKEWRKLLPYFVHENKYFTEDLIVDRMEELIAHARMLGYLGVRRVSVSVL